MDRNLTIGITASLLIHTVVALWVRDMETQPRIVEPPEKKAVRTVQEQIILPKPKPKPPEEKPPEVKPPETAPTQTPQQEAKPQAAPKRTPQPKSDQPAPKTPPPPSNEPPPLVLSKTYGGGGDDGVAVQSGKEDVLGDPGVEANEENVRRRPQPEVTSDQGGQGSDSQGDTKAKEPRKIEILQARPRESCDKFIQWPDGAESGGRVIEVTLQLEIGEDGDIRKVKILRGAGEPFDSEAMRDIRRCPFSAGSRDGKPTSSKIAFVVVFKPRS